MPQAGPKMREINEQRFWSRVDKTDSCWLWTGATYLNGYGEFMDGGKNKVAHRLAYELTVGPIPPGLEIDHLCRTRNCVNPEHLEPVSHSENMRRGQAARLLLESCPKGHPYGGGNAYFYKGYRRCRECRRINERGRKQHERV